MPIGEKPMSSALVPPIMRRVLVVSLFTLFLTAVAVPAGATQEWSESYLPGTGVTIWCDADHHPIFPMQPQEDDLYDPLSWAFSGEPECAYQDAINTYREAQGEERKGGGIGGAAVIYGAEDVGKTLTSTPEDAVFGVDVYHVLRPPSYGWDETPSVTGCGVLSTTLPSDPSPYPHGDGGGIVWDIVDPIWVGDDLTTCLSSTGLLHYAL